MQRLLAARRATLPSVWLLQRGAQTRFFSGHNKWSKIRHTKELLDRKRSMLFSKCTNEILAAAAAGGADANTNYRLGVAVRHAQSLMMPKAAIERLLQKPAKTAFDEITYEAFGPCGVSLVIETQSDNKNRSVSQLRHLLGTHSGKLEKIGSVLWMFDKRATLRVSNDSIADHELFLDAVVEAGADDVKEFIEGYQDVYVDAQQLVVVEKALEKSHFDVVFSGFSFVPSNVVSVPEAKVGSVEQLIDALSDEDYVQRVTHNADNIAQFFL